MSTYSPRTPTNLIGGCSTFKQYSMGRCHPWHLTYNINRTNTRKRVLAKHCSANSLAFQKLSNEKKEPNNKEMKK